MEKGLGHHFITSSSHFLNKTDFELYLFENCNYNRHAMPTSFSAVGYHII